MVLPARFRCLHHGYGEPERNPKDEPESEPQQRFSRIEIRTLGVLPWVYSSLAIL